MNLTQATLNYIAARDAAENADKAKKAAEIAMKQAFAEAGIDSNVVDGKKVTVTRKGRRTVNAESLAAMVSKALYNKMVKPAIDTAKFDAAVTTGQIKPEVADAVTKVTEYDEVRVTDLANNAEGSATVKVA
jgi:hypothetical protein